MIKRLEELNNFKRGDKNIQAIYRAQILIWPTTPLFIEEFFNGYIVGAFTTYGGTTYNRIIKLDKNTGAIDTGFNIGSGFQNRVLSIDKTPDDKLMVSGLFTSYNGTSKIYLTKLNTFGTIDTTFTGIYNLISLGNEVYVISSVDPITGDTYMIVRGSNNYNGSLIANSVGNLKIDINGVRDTAFIDRIESIQSVYQLYQRNLRFNPLDNKLYFATATTQVDGQSLVGLGIFDQLGTFNSVDSTLSGIPNDYEFYRNKVFITHQSSQRHIKCFLSDQNYIEDPTFLGGTRFNATARSIRISPVNNKLVVGGDFTTYNGVLTNRIAMINLNGSLELTFNIGTGFNASVRKVMMCEDGRVAVAGSFTEYNGIPVGNIVKLNLDGSLDTNFNSLTFNNVIDDIT